MSTKFGVSAVVSIAVVTTLLTGCKPSAQFQQQVNKVEADPAGTAAAAGAGQTTGSLSKASPTAAGFGAMASATTLATLAATEHQSNTSAKTANKPVQSAAKPSSRTLNLKQPVVHKNTALVASSLTASVNGAEVNQVSAEVNETLDSGIVDDSSRESQTQAVTTTTADPEKPAYSFYGTPDQPGYQIQRAIFDLFDTGVDLQLATERIVADVIDNAAVISDQIAMVTMADRPALAKQFVYVIAQYTQLGEATKQSILEAPESIDDIITLGVALYPDSVQEIITAATMTGEITEPQAILVALAAGADPTLIGATAAGADGISTFAAAPLGSGIGAGGTGGGDTTASSN